MKHINLQFKEGRFNPKQYTKSIQPIMTPEYKKLAEDFQKRQQRIIKHYGQPSHKRLAI